MELNLKGKNVLVTGSSRGIGKAIVQAFLDEGANVLANGRGNIDESELDLIQNKNLFFVSADVLTDEGREKIKTTVMNIFTNKIDILVCSVGSGKSAPPGTEIDLDWRKSLDLNLLSTTNIISSLNHLVRDKSGSIICISSICGIETLGAPLTYSASKAALNSYISGYSRVIGKRNIRINGVAPGNILFPGSTWDNKLQANEDAVWEMINKEVPLNRFGKVEDIANMVLFLASNKASFITGTIITVDGGQVRK